MEWGSIIALIGTTVVLCTGHLVLGLAVGSRMRGDPTSPPVTLEPFLATVQGMRHEMDELSRLSRDVPSLDRDIAAVIARLTLSLDELHRSLASQAAVPAAEAPKSNADERSHQLGTHAIGNVRILQWFNRPDVSRQLSGENRRYPFAVRQLLAPRRSEAFPTSDQFQLVQCHDLSPTEIRYLVDDPPKQDEVVIGLGIPQPVKFLLAHVEDYRSVYMYGRVGFLVTASFVQILDSYRQDSTSLEPLEAVS